LRTLGGVVPFFMIIGSSHKSKWVSFHDQSGTHVRDQKHLNTKLDFQEKREML